MKQIRFCEHCQITKDNTMISIMFFSKNIMKQLSKIILQDLYMEYKNHIGKILISVHSVKIKCHV